MNPIRTAARAIAIRDGRLHVTVNRDPNGVFYLLPGGGQIERGRSRRPSLSR